jgi:pyruvate/2-oxoglutarate dehydrogenase complex dihydrolipoamide dehydrogenase (E3) component
MTEPYDLVIIGAGSTGLTVADFAFRLGASTLNEKALTRQAEEVSP